MRYKCTAYKTDEQGRIYAYCGASKLVDGVLTARTNTARTARITRMSGAARRSR